VKEELKQTKYADRFLGSAYKTQKEEVDQFGKMCIMQVVKMIKMLTEVNAALKRRQVMLNYQARITQEITSLRNNGGSLLSIKDLSFTCADLQ